MDLGHLDIERKPLEFYDADEVAGAQALAERYIAAITPALAREQASYIRDIIESVEEADENDPDVQLIAMQQLNTLVLATLTETLRQFGAAVQAQSETERLRRATHNAILN